MTTNILAYQDQGPLTILITQTTTHYNVTINENDHHFLIKYLMLTVINNTINPAHTFQNLNFKHLKIIPLLNLNIQI